MDFLTLAQTLRERAGIQGAQGSPSTVVGQTGEMLRVVNWINEAWMAVQRAHQWNWMEGDFSFDTTAGTYVYAPAACGLEAGTALRKWKPETFRAYLLSAGVQSEQYLVEQDVDWFRDVYEFQGGQSGPPQIFAIRRRDRAILLGPNPNGVYRVRGQYRRAAAPMTVANASTPTGLPDELHMLIVYQAMQYYAAYEAAPEVMEEAKALYKSMIASAEEFLLDTPELGGPLA